MITVRVRRPLRVRVTWCWTLRRCFVSRGCAALPTGVSLLKINGIEIGGDVNGIEVGGHASLMEEEEAKVV